MVKYFKKRSRYLWTAPLEFWAVSVGLIFKISDDVNCGAHYANLLSLKVNMLKSSCRRENFLVLSGRRRWCFQNFIFSLLIWRLCQTEIILGRFWALPRKILQMIFAWHWLMADCLAQMLLMKRNADSDG